MKKIFLGILTPFFFFAPVLVRAQNAVEVAATIALYGAVEVVPDFPTPPISAAHIAKNPLNISTDIAAITARIAQDENYSTSRLTEYEWLLRLNIFREIFIADDRRARFAEIELRFSEAAIAVQREHAWWKKAENRANEVAKASRTTEKEEEKKWREFLSQNRETEAKKAHGRFVTAAQRAVLEEGNAEYAREMQNRIASHYEEFTKRRTAMAENKAALIAGNKVVERSAGIVGLYSEKK